MAYALVQDIPASWEDYERVAGVLIEPVPPGLILHVAGPTDEGIRIIAVWESEQAWQRFDAECFAKVLSPLSSAARAGSTFRDLHPIQMLVASAEPAFAGSHPKEEQ